MELADVRPPRWLRWATVVAVAGGILYASLLDSPSSGLPALGPLGLFGTDKWLHALAYAALAASLASVLAPGGRPAVVAGVAALLAVGYGVGIEFVQAPLAARHFSVADMVADAVGAGAAVVAWRVLAGLTGGGRTGSRPESEI
ncbi:VanZ family protein [Halorussus sp. AFM4]|uniref:VanZ family protein n=1 Tax=Halorussus sp. AFM4 TaxID=3421651 RepID=UPI003EBD74B4